MARPAPGRHFNLPELATTPDPYAVIKNPYDTPEDLLAGSEVFGRTALCAMARTDREVPGGRGFSIGKWCKATVIGRFLGLLLWVFAEPRCQAVTCRGPKSGAW